MPSTLSRRPRDPGSIARIIALSGPVLAVLFCAAVRAFVDTVLIPSTVLEAAIGYALFTFVFMAIDRRGSP